MNEQEEGREMSESITEELREYAADYEYALGKHVCWFADRIDARFDRELTAKQDEVDGLRSDNADLQARLDASIPMPVDIDGARWTGEDVDKPFSLTDGDKATEGIVREIAYSWPHKGWWIVDEYDTHYPADKCRHVAPEPPDSQERIDADARKWSCEYFNRPTAECDGCPAHNDMTPCRASATLDLLRRQRELDGAGEKR